MNAGVDAPVDAPEWGDVDLGQRPGSHPDDEFLRFSRMDPDQRGSLWNQCVATVESNG